ncbi:MAG TPA: 30S ribosomal protein S4 [Dehalococcoidia bacterium]|nr:30S ribosomal protein S4 [Dehalococcoidia bacterium]
MARSTEPSCRLCRRVGEKLFLKGARCLGPKCAVDKRGTPPGMHTLRKRKRKLSDRGLQLREKQKARYIYEVLERQFRRFFEEASKAPGATGETLLQLLERRLDSVVYRLGFAESRAQARQIVHHGHIQVRGRRTDVPSCLVEIGDVISFWEASRDTVFYKALKENPPSRPVPAWLSRDGEKLEGKVLAVPSRSDIEISINEKAIVEYYAR